MLYYDELNLYVKFTSNEYDYFSFYHIGNFSVKIYFYCSVVVS